MRLSEWTLISQSQKSHSDRLLDGECVKYHHEVMADDPECGEWDEDDKLIEESEGEEL